MFSHILSLALSLGLGVSSLTATNLAAEPASASTRSYEQLEGFVGIVVKQINKSFGTERLPAANGFPVEPGLYLTVGPNKMMIFDRVGTTLQGGQPADSTAASECKSGCSRAYFDPLRLVWLDLLNEGAAIGDEMPNRVLIGADAAIPGRSFVDAAYAAAESRPGSVPSMYILLNAGPGGLRARNFFLVPPGGLRLSGATNALGLRVIVKGGQQYEVSSADGRSVKKQTINSAQALGELLNGIDRRFPSKNAVVLEVAGSATVGDLVQAMVVTEERFPIPILSMGDRLTR
jgi:hypothetical protein